LRQTDQNVYVFTFYPQIAYADLAQAVKKWRQSLESDPEETILFSQGILVSTCARCRTPGLESGIGKFLRREGVI
jgi:hypothetical protein